MHHRPEGLNAVSYTHLYGLGLYIVKTILAQHKEQITVTSENGFTAFTFTMQMAH